MSKINHNDLLPWFTDDHGTLPKAYLDSCRKFFEEISHKPQVTSHKLPGPRPISNANKGLIHKQQATSLPQSGGTVVTKKGKL